MMMLPAADMSAPQRLARRAGGRCPVLAGLVPLGDVDVLDGQAPVVGLAGLEVVGAVNALERGQARDVVVDLLGACPGAWVAQRGGPRSCCGSAGGWPRRRACAAR